MHPTFLPMKHLLACSAAGLALATLLPSSVAAASAPRPNLIFLLADDLGYGDIGAYGQTKIRTPNLDQLARDGMRFTQHYSGHNVCAPSRCVLMTGKHPGHAYIRNNRGGVGQSGSMAEGQEPVPPGELKLPLTLQQLGYATGAFGKWGLGAVGSTGDPNSQGIGVFYGYNDQAVAHNFYPTSLWHNRERVKLNNREFRAHQKLPEGADPRDPASYAQFIGQDYAPDFINEAARRFLRENKDRPFFLYYPTTVPHLALQVPEDDPSLAEYRRLFPDEPYVGDQGYLPHRTPRAAYAAMITRLDREIGRLLALVDDFGLRERTIVIFSSDNGPLAARWGGTDTAFFNSNRGLRGAKGGYYEAGVRVPCLVRWTGKIRAGTVSDRVTGFEDWLPTLMELIGAPERTPAGIDGISFAPTLLGKTQPERPFLYRESQAQGGQQLVRQGDWKLVRTGLHAPGGAKKFGKATELFNLRSDPYEKTDVAAQHPDLVAQLIALGRAQRVPSTLWPIQTLDAESAR
jgi:arylsulfatase A